MIGFKLVAAFHLVVNAVDDACTAHGNCPQDSSESDFIDSETTGIKVSMLQRRSSDSAEAEVGLNASLLDQATSRKASKGGTPWRPLDSSLRRPSDGQLMTFYAYRVQNDESYAPLNQNMASLGGVLWYLQNEITTRLDKGCYRRFKKTKIERYKITYKATSTLLKQRMNFGVRVAFDSGKNTGDGCSNSMHQYKGSKMYDKYGYVVGCNYLGDPGGCNYPACPCKPHEKQCLREGYCAPGKSGLAAITYPNATWYSFPGPCPTNDIKTKSSVCKATAPGGFCKNPDGRGDCTYHFEEAGEISLDELSGVSPKYRDFHSFCKRGCREYIKYGKGKDKGSCGITFYNGRHDLSKAKGRMEAIDRMFKDKFPNMPRDSELPAPPCDFNKNMFFRGRWSSW